MSGEPSGAIVDARLDVTVLMSVYNGAAYLCEAADSILEQTFSDFEFLIIDDASDDDTPSILADYAARDRRIRLVRNETNLGLTRSLNKGIDLARGSYIARMDADDISRPHRLQRQLAFMSANPEIAVSSCAAQLFGKRHEVWYPPQSHDEIVVALSYNNCLCHSGVMLRKAFLDEHGLRYPEVDYVEDYLLWAHCSETGRLAGLREILVDYRTHSTSIGAMNQAGQRANARQAQRFILNRAFGLDASDHEIAIHQRLYMAPRQFFIDPGDAISWLIRIINEEKNHLLSSSLRKLIANNYIICMKSADRKARPSLRELHVIFATFGRFNGFAFATRSFIIFFLSVYFRQFKSLKSILPKLN